METTEKCLIWKRPRLTHCLECVLLKRCSQGKSKVEDRITFLESLKVKAKDSKSENKAFHLESIKNEIDELRSLME